MTAPPDRTDLRDHPNGERLDALFRSDRFTGAMNAELLDWGGGWARVRWVPSGEQRNFAGLVHGGAMFAVGDMAFAVASNSWGREAVALSANVHFHHSPDPEVPVVAEAWERVCGKRTGSYLIELRAQERRLASLHAMVYRREEWHFGADAWPDAWRARH